MGGSEILQDPLRNRGTAFTEEDRDWFGLYGLLPTAVETLEEQVERAWAGLERQATDLDKHIYVRSVQDVNEVLFYRLLLDHVEELLPIVYTPTVGQACRWFSRIYRRPRGLFISYPLRERIRELLRNRPHREIDVIVATDGQRILGIGDQGIGGMGIPIGKLSLYTLIGGIHPARTLPIMLDCGTDNEQILADPAYLGWRHPRIDGPDYDDFIDRFVTAVREELPGVLLQWEDFATPHARPILDRYRDRLLTFNDDVQGTAAVVVGTLSGAAAATHTKMPDQQLVLLGAGSAAIGVADLICQTMIGDGLSEAEARRRFTLVDIDGVLHTGRDDLTEEQRPFARAAAEVATWSRSRGGPPGLLEAVEHTSPTVLIGLSTARNAFTEQVVRAMAARVERPVIMPLSNPTSRSEADPVDLLAWTGGRALVATGSPYPPVVVDGRPQRVSQCNNVYVFPALGLGAVAAQATRVTDRMIIAAAAALGSFSPALGDPTAPLLPGLGELRDAAFEIAVAVGRQAIVEGVAPQRDEDELRRRVAATQWFPDYELVQPASRASTASAPEPPESYLPPVTS